jgi:predicted adenylyl cyclase CyaB
VARNIEIKARIASVDELMPRARALARRDAQRIEQDDTFFRVPHGRLKLRTFADGSAELIHYQRADRREAKLSDYRRVPAPDAAALRVALERALGALGRVRKQRWLLLAGQTRIHLDRVEGLGDFIELEVVLRDDQSAADGARIADQLMHELGLARAERIAGAYLDLLLVRA